MELAIENKDLQVFTVAAKVFFEHLNGQFAIVLDTNMQIVYESNDFIEFFDLQKNEKSLFANRKLQQYFELDKFILAAQNTCNDRIKRQLCLPLLINGRIRLLNFYFGAVVNNNHVIGVVAYVIRFNPLSRIEMVLQGIENSDVSAHDNLTSINLTERVHLDYEPAIKLTSREENVIFLLILNFTSREIAAILSQIESKKISKDAIDKLITNQLQVKFDVVYRYKLVERLIELGYHKLIPEVFAGKFVRESLFLD